MELHQTKSSVQQRKPSTKQNDNLLNELFVSHLSNKGLIFKIYKLRQLNNQRTR